MRERRGARGCTIIALAALLMAGLLSGCEGQGGDDGRPEDARSAANSAANSVPGPSASAPPAVDGAADAALPRTARALERTARQAGLIPDGTVLSPIGLYRHRHEAGRDSLCLLPGGKGEMRFGLEASFGENVDCQGEGTARLSGDRIILNFARSACIIVAHYEGDRISVPGAVDEQCRKHCTNRGSLAGVSFPRVSGEAAIAADARADKGDGALCPAA